MFADPEVACILRIQQVPDFLIVNLECKLQNNTSALNADKAYFDI